METKHYLLTLALAIILSLGACGDDTPPETPGPTTEAATNGAVDVTLCDNHTKTTVVPTAATTPEAGQQIADSLMAQWKAKNPDENWVENTQKSWTVAKPFDNSYILEGDNNNQSTYGSYTALDIATWAREAELAATAGAKVFHSADELGSTIAVSCDMCHPDGANTHPETYPKYQTQLGRAVLLRDMINWCLEHPVRAEPMAADDPRMRAMESYILAQRSGKTLSYGKH